MIEEYDLFSYSTPKFKIDKPVRLIELFAGIGAQAKAFERLGIPFEHYRVVEWDKYAMASYNAVHGTDFETSDVQKIHAADLGIEERDKYIYVLTYSFPCQDISGAGKRQGYTKGDSTRSGLLWEVERILDECNGNLPQVLLMENVPLVISKSNGNLHNFQLWRSKLESLGYNNFVQLVNSKDHGIPQNRNRCFMVSILGDYHYTFPKKRKLELKLKDMLEDKVDEKYYLSDETVQYFIANTEKNRLKGNGFRFEPVERERESRNADSGLLEDQDNGCVSERRPGGGFIQRGTGKHQSNEVFDINDETSRCVQASDHKDPIKIVKYD